MRDDASKITEEAFYLQYFFPPSSVGETGRTGGPGATGVRVWECVWRRYTFLAN